MTVHKSGVKLEDLKEGDWLPEEDANRLLNEPDSMHRIFLTFQKLLVEHLAAQEKQRAPEEPKP